MLAILTTPFGFLTQSIPSAVLNSQLQTLYSTIPTKTFGITNTKAAALTCYASAAAFIQYYDGNNTFDRRSAASILLSICGWQ